MCVWTYLTHNLFLFSQAKDYDRPDGIYSHITYNIVGGQPVPNGLWIIDPNSGYVKATSPVPYPLGGKLVEWMNNKFIDIKVHIHPWLFQKYRAKYPDWLIAH